MPDHGLLRPCLAASIRRSTTTRRGFDESADPSYLPSTMAIAALVLLILILLFLTDLAVLVLFSFRIPSLRMRERTVLG